MINISTRVAGVTFEDRQSIIKKLKYRDKVEFVREPNNSHDPNAIKVMVCPKNESEFVHLGYIPAELAATLCKTWDEYIYEGEILEIFKGDDSPSHFLHWGVRVNMFKERKL